MGIPIPIPVGRGAGGLVVLALLAFLLLSQVGPGLFGSLGGGGPTGSQAPAAVPSGPAPGTPSPSDTQADFVSAVLASTEDTWPAVLERHGVSYPPPTLVLFDGQVRSACGFQSAAVGPFYCPNDQKVYLDLSFFRDLDQRFGAPGDFAQAYVIAHEIGHHVQTVLGITQQVDRRMGAVSETQANDLSVRMELQADCYAGVWGHRAAQQGMLEPGDVEEGLRAAASIGDDRLQRQSQGFVVPESFTHGSSAQRVQWFRRGLERGDIDACDTFSAAQL